MAITDTNLRPGNEVWMFDTLKRLEDDGQLAAFCGHVEIPIAAKACRDLLAFPPYMERMAEEIATARSPKE